MSKGNQKMNKDNQKISKDNQKISKGNQKINKDNQKMSKDNQKMSKGIKKISEGTQTISEGTLKLNKKEIIQFMEQTEQGPVSFRRLLSAFKVNGKVREDMKSLLRELLESGQIIQIKGGKYGICRKMNLVSGHIKAHPSGFGFVIPDEEGQADIFISPAGMREVFDGDGVMARVDREDRTGRRSGSIVRILERVHKTVIGRFEKTKHISFVVPNDPSLTQDIIIPKDNKDNKDNKSNDKSNKDNKDSKDSKDNKGLKPQKGQLVMVEILEYPTKYRNPTGRIVEVLGWPDDPGIDVEVVIRNSQLPDAFPENVQREAKVFRPELTDADMKGRRDLRNLLTITIDGETARDFDDAISWQSLQPLTEEPEKAKADDAIALQSLQPLTEKPGRAKTRDRLWVHIADVSSYVSEGSALDEEAFLRGTSVYFPERAIPMLPQELSNELCSLKPRVDRLTVSARMDFDAEGHVVDYEIFSSVINSNERMTYTQVRDILSPETETPAEFQYLEPTIKSMGELSTRLRQNRMKAGSIDFDLPEPEIILDLRGDVQSIIRAERNPAHILIEEFMLMANQVVAEHLSSLKVPSLYRIHEEPEEADVIEFMEFLRDLGWNEEGSAEKPQTEKKKRKEPPPQSVKTRLDRAVLQKILAYFRGKPEEAVINYLLLRTMKRARYSILNVGHFGLAMKEYTHFTSPIRRYPDLVVHRLLRQILNKEAGKPLQGQKQDQMQEMQDQMQGQMQKMQGQMQGQMQDTDLSERLATIANHSSLRERIAEDAERKIIALKRTRYMQEKVGEEYTGIISGVTAFGFFVELYEIFVEGLVHIRNLADDYYQFDERKHSLEGTRTGNFFHIGDRVKVQVSHVDLSRVHIDFSFISFISKDFSKK
jgi:ribonuclease R